MKLLRRREIQSLNMGYWGENKLIARNQNFANTRFLLVKRQLMWYWFRKGRKTTQSTMKPMAIHALIRSQKLASWVKKQRKIDKHVRCRLSSQKMSNQDRVSTRKAPRRTGWARNHTRNTSAGTPANILSLHRDYVYMYQYILRQQSQTLNHVCVMYQ